MAVWNAKFDQETFDAWLKTRPAVIQDLGRRFPPNRLYRMTDGRLRCYPFSYCEDGTLTVVVDGQFNRVLFSRRVFGVRPDSLVECELPAAGEDLGDTAAEAGYTEDEVRDILIPEIRRRQEGN